MKTLRNILLLTALLVPSVVQPMKRKNDPTNQGANKRPKIQTPLATLEEPQLDDIECILPDNFLEEVCSNPPLLLEEYSSGPQWIFVDESEEILAEYNSIGHLVEQSTDEEVSNIKIDTGDNKYSLETTQQIASSFSQANPQQYSYQNYPYGGVSYGAFAPQQVTINHNPVTIINNIVQQQTTSSIDMIKLRWQDAKRHEWIELPSKALSHSPKLAQFIEQSKGKLSDSKLTLTVICDCLIEIDKNSSADYQYPQETFNVWFTKRCEYISLTDTKKIVTAGKKLGIDKLSQYPKPQEKTFVCKEKECLKEFTKPSALDAHMRVHSQLKPFMCPHCSHCATQKGNLKTHMKIHSDKKEFECPHCEYRTVQKANLLHHIERKHQT